MNIAFVIYDKATGFVLYRGQDPYGAAMQIPHLAEGQAAMDVPIEALAKSEIDLAPIRQVLEAQIDYDAEMARAPFITAGTGQAMTYTYKADEARAWNADHNAPTPFLTAEADAREMTVPALAAEVLAAIAEWTRVGAIIEGKRMCAKKALAAADGLPALAAAVAVDWSITPPVVAESPSSEPVAPVSEPDLAAAAAATPNDPPPATVETQPAPDDVSYAA